MSIPCLLCRKPTVIHDARNRGNRFSTPTVHPLIKQHQQGMRLPLWICGGFMVSHTKVGLFITRFTGSPRQIHARCWPQQRAGKGVSKKMQDYGWLKDVEKYWTYVPHNLQVSEVSGYWVLLKPQFLTPYPGAEGRHQSRQCWRFGRGSLAFENVALCHRWWETDAIWCHMPYRRI